MQCKKSLFFLVMRFVVLLSQSTDSKNWKENLLLHSVVVIVEGFLSEGQFSEENVLFLL